MKSLIWYEYIINVSAITHLTRMFLPSGFLWQYQLEIIAMGIYGTLVSWLHFQLVYSAGLFQALQLGVLGVFGAMDCKSILNKLVCEIDRMKNVFY